MSSNLKLEYLYRSAGNYKYWGSVVFTNHKNLSLTYAIDSLEQLLMDRTFVADQVRIPELFPCDHNTDSADDHCLHEFHSLEATNEAASDEHRREFDAFVGEIKAAAECGWIGFSTSGGTSRIRFDFTS